MENLNLVEIGKRLRACREAHESHQADVCTMLGIGRSHISMQENGHVAMKCETLARYCDFYTVSADYLMYGNDSPYVYVECDMWWRNLRQAYRDSCFTTKYSLALACGIAPYELSRYFRHGPGYITSLHKLCCGLGVKPDYILFGASS